MEKNTNSTQQAEFYKNKHREELKYHNISFALMIVFTIIAFGLVMGDYSKTFVIPIIIVLAAVQVMFQLYYFMHMKDRGHELPALMIYSGVFAAVLTILALTTIVWL
ncbi:cytochrome c oxidase subunit IVB [Salirhabdus salicampi]|uniref:cytochrome c oxidase subunit IVB n=1 Tax=Salirhabdus salicampi TaxID=476102 RepID=UPI0020C30393|nr:cytochrome c oxidase subunit IVB [Salirhabdus salicampi]MCP8616640.1 cytochrome c oxidase subunit IVB [Salirhabdus salicampi]